MRPLLRPCLIAVSRLGIFLAVLAWLVGQWWTVAAFCDPATLFICRSGWVLGHETGVSANGQSYGVQLFRHPASGEEQDDEEGSLELLFSASSPEFEQQVSVMTVMYTQAFGDSFLAFRHSLVTAFLLLIYGLVKLSDRGQPGTPEAMLPKAASSMESSEAKVKES